MVNLDTLKRLVLSDLLQDRIPPYILEWMVSPELLERMVLPGVPELIPELHCQDLDLVVPLDLQGWIVLLEFWDGLAILTFLGGSLLPTFWSR